MTDMAPQPQKTLKAIWWLHPTAVFAVVVLGSMLLALLVSPEAYSLYGTPKYLSGWHFGLALGAVLMFAAGRRAAGSWGAPAQVDEQSLDRSLLRWFIAAAALSLCGYAAWFAVAMKNGLSLGMIRELFMNPDSGAVYIIKEDMFTTIPGVTTCTQFGIAAIILGTWLYLRGAKQVRVWLGLLLAVTLVRAGLNSERLAIIEVVLPAGIVWLRFRVLGVALSGWQRSAVNLGPIAAVAGLVMMFGSIEYFRSWPAYQQEFDSVAEFTIWRLTGYYSTALNNGALLLEFRGTWPLPYNSLHAIWKFPLVRKSPLAYDRLTGLDPGEEAWQLLGSHANQELNNDSGLFQPALDFGIVGYFVFWLAVGFLAGRLYRGYLAGNRAGMLLYPILFVSLLETPRILYLPSARVFPSLVLLVGFIAWTQWGRRPVLAPHSSSTAAIGRPFTGET